MILRFFYAAKLGYIGASIFILGIELQAIVAGFTLETFRKTKFPGPKYSTKPVRINAKTDKLFNK